MPFDGRSLARPGGSAFDDIAMGDAGQRFDVASTRPTTQNTPLFGMDGAEWRGFFVAITGMLALVLGVSALVLAALGR